MKGSGNLYEYLVKQEALLKFRVFVLPQTLGCAITPIGHWVLWLARPVLEVQGHTGQHLDCGGGGVVIPLPPSCLFIYLFLYLFLLFRAALVAYGGSQLGFQLELQLPAKATTTAMPDPSCICNLHPSSRQPQILNSLSKARDRTCNLMVPSRIHFRCAATGTLLASFLAQPLCLFQTGNMEHNSRDDH